MEGLGRIERKDTIPVSEREQLVRFLQDRGNWTKERWPDIEDASRRLSVIEKDLPETMKTPHTSAGLPALH